VRLCFTSGRQVSKLKKKHTSTLHPPQRPVSSPKLDSCSNVQVSLSYPRVFFVRMGGLSGSLEGFSWSWGPPTWSALWPRGPRGTPGRSAVWRVSRCTGGGSGAPPATVRSSGSRGAPCPVRGGSQGQGEEGGREEGGFSDTGGVAGGRWGTTSNLGADGFSRRWWRARGTCSLIGS